MAAIFAFQCTCCNEIHEGSPSFLSPEPDAYAGLSEAQRQSMGWINSDACVITRDDHTDYFVLAILEVPIHGVEQPFSWAVWVSLSEKSFKRYAETYESPVQGETFFGWVANALPAYPYDRPRAADVIVQLGGHRPKLRLHAREPEDDALVIDQIHGISVSRAQQIAERVMHPVIP